MFCCFLISDILYLGHMRFVIVESGAAVVALASLS